MQFIRLLILSAVLVTTSVWASGMGELYWKFNQHFINYTTWPADSAQGNFCTIGDIELPVAHEDVFESAHGQFSVRVFSELPAVRDLKSCHVLYFGSGFETAELEFYLAPFRGSPVLTIGSQEAFIKLGGHIQFTIEASKLRFFIDTSNLNNSGLTMHPAILRLAATKGNK